MEWNKRITKDLLRIVLLGIAFCVALLRLDQVVRGVRWLLGVMAPLLIGGAIAFILNVPMRAIERGLPRGRRLSKFRRPAAMVLTLVLCAAFFLMMYPYVSGIPAPTWWLDIGKKVLNVYYSP